MEETHNHISREGVCVLCVCESGRVRARNEYVIKFYLREKYRVFSSLSFNRWLILFSLFGKISLFFLGSCDRCGQAKQNVDRPKLHRIRDNLKTGIFSHPTHRKIDVSESNFSRWSTRYKLCRGDSVGVQSFLDADDAKKKLRKYTIFITFHLSF